MRSWESRQASRGFPAPGPASPDLIHPLLSLQAVGDTQETEKQSDGKGQYGAQGPSASPVGTQSLGTHPPRTRLGSGHTESGYSPPAHQAGVSLHQEVGHIPASEVLDHLPQASHGLWWRQPPSSHWAVRQQAAHSRLAALAGWGWRLWSPVSAGQDAGHIRRDLRDGKVAGQGVCALESPVESGRAVGAGRGR